AEDQYVKPVDYALALQMLQEHPGGRIARIITSETGAMGTVNGWFQSAVTGIPVVDAAGNGRAHPTGVMGSMALDRLEGYRSVQAAVGGIPMRAGGSAWCRRQPGRRGSPGTPGGGPGGGLRGGG